MKVVILAGGFGTRISEESHLIPKPMIPIGELPIIWHIMKYYSSYGHNEFIICSGYKQYVIKEFFSNYFLHTSDLKIDLRNNSFNILNTTAEPWTVTVVDTGLNTMTGGRIKRIKDYVDNETFMLTYGDGLSDVNIDELISSHKKSKCLVTLTAIQPGERFGKLDIDSTNSITSFREKTITDGGWINGGFMVLEPSIFDYIENDTTIFEKDTLERLSKESQLRAYRHKGFWQCMDTLRDKQYLENLWNGQSVPWKRW
jgi:glucose-1-phosphate cytidylyltransferase